MIVAPRGAASAALVHRHADLGRQHDVLATRPERLAEELLGAAARAAIDIGGVEQCDAEIQRLVHDRSRCRIIDAAAEVVAPQADQRHAQPGIARADAAPRIRPRPCSRSRFTSSGLDAAQCAQQVVGVLAEQRRAGHFGRRVGQLDRAADGLVGAARRIVDIDDHLARLQMRVGQHLAGVQAGAARHPGIAEQPHHLVLGALARPFLDDRVQRRAVLPARLRRLEARIVGQLRPAHHARSAPATSAAARG